MKNKIKITFLLLLFGMFIVPALADDNNTSLPAAPSFSQGWTSLGATAQGKIVTMLNLFFTIVVITAIAYTFLGALNYFFGGREHNPERRNTGFHQIGMGIVVVFVCLIVYGAILYLFTS